MNFDQFLSAQLLHVANLLRSETNRLKPYPKACLELWRIGIDAAEMKRLVNLISLEQVPKPLGEAFSLIDSIIRIGGIMLNPEATSLEKPLANLENELRLVLSGQDPAGLINNPNGFSFDSSSQIVNFGSREVPIKGETCRAAFAALLGANPRFGITGQQLQTAIVNKTGLFVSRPRAVICSLRKQLRDGLNLSFDPIQNISRESDSRWRLVGNAEIEAPPNRTRARPPKSTIAVKPKKSCKKKSA